MDKAINTTLIIGPGFDLSMGKHTSYKEFDDYLGGLRLFFRTEKIDAPDSETAKAIAWKRALTENPNRVLDKQSARKSHRK